MTSMEIAITAVCRVDEYLMHLREGDKRRGAIGLIGFFGGELEAGEAAVEAARRELGEETNLDLHARAFYKLGPPVHVESDRGGQPLSVKAHVYKVLIPFGTKVETKDPRDTLVVANLVRVKQHLENNELTPATAAAFEEFILKGL